MAKRTATTTTMNRNEPDGVVPGCSKSSKSSKSQARKNYGYHDTDYSKPEDPDPDIESCFWLREYSYDHQFRQKWQKFQADLNNKSSSETISPPSSSDADNLLTFEKLLSAIGFLGLNEQQYREMFQSFPLVKTDDEKSLTIEENNLGKIYKCDVCHHGCYFTTDCPETFEKHLEQKHPDQSLYCIYCTRFEDEDHLPKTCSQCESFDHPLILLDHINTKHSLDLKYQCNLCFYRAFTPDHIFIHQAYEHPDSFLQTIGKLDQNPVEDGSVKKTCKIIVCTSLDDTMRDFAESFYLEQFRSKPKLINNCIYCKVPFNNDNLFNHFVTKHPELPIFAKLCGHVSGSSQHPEPAAMIDAFLNKLKIITVKRTYDDKTMKAAFQAYNYWANEADSSQPKGTKRKQSDDDGNGDGHGGGDGDGDGNGDGGGEDHSANQDEMDSTSTTDPPASKRRPKGLFGGYVSVPTWNQTKAAVGMATTAIVALGFYKFAHYLPMTIKKLTE